MVVAAQAHYFEIDASHLDSNTTSRAIINLDLAREIKVGSEIRRRR
jgi:hypothetical protein